MCFTALEYKQFAGLVLYYDLKVIKILLTYPLE